MTILYLRPNEKHNLRSIWPKLSEWQPFRAIEKGVLVAPSGLRNGGLGLFATRSFKAGETLCLYSGECYGDSDDNYNTWVLKALWENHKEQTTETWYIDASKPYNLAGRRSNDACDLETYPHTDKNIHAGLRSNFYNNATFGRYCSDEPHPIIGMYTVPLIALYDIEPFTEIFTAYGSDYWKNCPNYSRFHDHRILKY